MNWIIKHFLSSQLWWALLGFVSVCMFWQGNIRPYFAHSKASFGRWVTPSPSVWACFKAWCSSRPRWLQAVGFKRLPLLPTQGVGVYQALLSVPVSWRRAPQPPCSVGSPVGAGTVILWLTALQSSLLFLPSAGVSLWHPCLFTSPSVPLCPGGPALWWMARFIRHTTDTNVYCGFKCQRQGGMAVWMSPSTPPSHAFQASPCLGVRGVFFVSARQWRRFSARDFLLRINGFY